MINPTIYNASIGAGVAAIGVGAGAQWGWPAGLMTSGALVVALAVFALRVGVR